jgi:hypothetical protein
MFCESNRENLIKSQWDEETSYTNNFYPTRIPVAFLSVLIKSGDAEAFSELRQPASEQQHFLFIQFHE